MDKLLDVRDVEKHYPTGEEGTLEVLRGVNLNVGEGEVVSVVGESGTGKSTLLHILGALDRPSSGNVYFREKDIFDQSDADLANFRNRQVGFVFQFHHLLPEFNAVENVAMPALIRGQSMRESQGRASELLEMLGLGERLDHRPGALSGGEQQRVAIARALMNAPALVLADEPTGNLDVHTADILHEEIVRLSRELHQTFVLATHNLTLAALGDRIWKLEYGVLMELSPDELPAAD